MECNNDNDDVHWRVIIITCTSTKVREALEQECKRLSAGGLLPKHEFMYVVNDPRLEDECSLTYTGETDGVGSGGATINAILVAIERLSANHNHTTVNSELVYNSRILVVHHGRTLVHSPGGSAFIHIDASQSYIPPKLRIAPPTLLQNSIWMATMVAAQSDCGVWVVSVDSHLTYSPTLKSPKTSGLNGALICSVSSHVEHAQHHGVVFSHTDTVEKIQYRTPYEQLKETFPTNYAPVISGLVFLSASLTERLLGLHMLTPLDRCTYYGTDSGIPPLQMSLYFDLLAPLCSGVEENAYLSGFYGAGYAKSAHFNAHTQQESRMARLQIWKLLHGLKAHHHSLDGVVHHYISSDLSFEKSIRSLFPAKEGGSLTSGLYIEGTINTKEVRIADSWIGKDLTVNCSTACSLSGFHLPHENGTLDFSDEFIWQCYPQNENSVVVCYGENDILTRHYGETDVTVFNKVFSLFAERTHIRVTDIWPNTEKQHCTMLNAKLYCSDLSLKEQVAMLTYMKDAITDDKSQQYWLSKIEEWRSMARVSLYEATKTCNIFKLMTNREMVHLATVKQFIHATSDQVGGKSLLPLFQYVASRDHKYVTEVINAIHGELRVPRASTARLLANAADLLGCMAAGKGGLRSGPAGNPQWKNPLVKLKAGNQREAVDQMISICQDWISLDHPDYLIRAARHLERASQIVISREVETAQKNVKIPWELSELKQKMEIGEWVEAHCPARLDLAGGWSDTPPVCYEQGGAVLNVAVKVNGQKPMGARMRFVPEFHIICTLQDWSGGDLVLTWTELEQLCDYDNPVAQGALVKAVLVYCHVLDLSSDDSLASQLEKRYGGGIEIVVWSRLPKGSGLGGSSLLAGTLVATIAVLIGHPPPQHNSIIHATLVIEQWLTTGGGWQDQVGGLVGGAKLGVSHKGTPLTVTTYKLPISQEFISTLNSHLLLLYTGKVRLARNLLQTVIRNWYARDKIVTECFSRLPKVALKASEAMLSGSIMDLGSCIDEYWNLKKKVAPGCEPEKVSDLMSCLREHCFGMSLAGAGGGGYLYALKGKPDHLPSHIDLGDLSCDLVEIDEQGIEMIRNGDKLTHDMGDAIILSNEALAELLQLMQ
ncbi:L-fucose kinase-like isoform X1 [Macrobrachium nipponense]|uniref:L-fucose kinase-like isoform X1 n=2 Tax=Macrobrachium nipponense TaxID=159736 RepID=UPI0030C7D861